MDTVAAMAMATERNTDTDMTTMVTAMATGKDTNTTGTDIRRY